MYKNKTIERFRINLPDQEVLQLHRNTRPELYDDFIINKLRLSLPLEQLSRYPNIENFLNKLSKFINIDSDNIMISSGIDGTIRTIFELFSDFGTNVAVLTPTYKMYEVYGEAFGVNLIKIPSNKNLVIDINDIYNIIPKVKIIFIPNPHEPIENVFTREQILEIVKFSAQHDVLVIIDEAYFMFGAPTVIDLAINNINLLVMRSFSKGFGLPSIRLGYTVGNKELIKDMNSRRLAYETNSLSSWVAEWAMDNFKYFEEYIQEIILTRSFLKNQLQNKGFRVHGSCSNTILVNLSSSESAIKMYEKLRKYSIWVRGLIDIPDFSSWISLTIGKKSTAIKFLNIFLDN